MWSYPEIIRSVSDAFQAYERDLLDEHAVVGLDSYREIDLHPIAYTGLMPQFDTVLREVCLPSTERDLPGRNARERVDLVILPDGKKSIYDPVDAHKDLKRASGTLFEPVAALAAPTPGECPPSEAMWIEIKSVPQFRYVDGVPVPNTKYANELISGPREDVIKLASDPEIRHAGVLTIVFTEHQEAGPHDIAVSVREMIDQDLPVGSPEIEQIEIQDRGGNAWCTLGLIPVRL